MAKDDKVMPPEDRMTARDRFAWEVAGDMAKMGRQSSQLPKGWKDKVAAFYDAKPDATPEEVLALIKELARTSEH